MRVRRYLTPHTMDVHGAVAVRCDLPIVHPDKPAPESIAKPDTTRAQLALASSGLTLGVAIGRSGPSADSGIVSRCHWGDGMPMRKKRRYLTATMPDGYVKTIGPTTDSFTHYWRIVAELDNGKTEVFWGHARSLVEARRKRAPAEEAARTRGWKSFAFEIAELVETPA